MKYLLGCLGLAALCLVVNANRVERDFSVFKVVKFPNGACEGSNNRNGTCFTKQECDDKNGKQSGTCADGYGVCCTFEIDECGKKSSQNNTYIMNPGTIEEGDCTTTICPSGENICRLRLDFMTFTIAQPSTETLTPVLADLAGALTHSNAGQCIEDSLSITCPGGPTPKKICGTATGDHMYIDAAESCNDITFFIGPNTATRMWNIKVSQIDCDDMVNLPPPGCMQWFTEDEGTIRTFNWGGNHLANQDQKICFRKNKGMCGVCVGHAATNTDDFSLTGATAGAMAGDGEGCGAAGTAFDHLEVLGAAVTGFVAAPPAANSRFCGATQLNTAGGGEMAATTSVCTARVPLSVRFVSDAGEFTDGAAPETGTKGFQLKYKLQSDCTP